MALKLYDKVVPSGDFALMDAAHVEMPDGTRLPEMFPVFLTEKEYEDLKAAGADNPNTPYFVYEAGDG